MRATLDDLSDAARFRVALSRAQLEGKVRRLYQLLAPRLPHEMVSMILAHVAAATLRGDQVSTVPYMELYRRWDRRELQGRAARRRGMVGTPTVVESPDGQD